MGGSHAMGSESFFDFDYVSDYLLFIKPQSG